MDISLLTGCVLCSRGVALRTDTEGVTNDTVLRLAMPDSDGVAIMPRLLLNGVEIRGVFSTLDTDVSISPASLCRGTGLEPAIKVVLCLPTNSAWYDFVRSRQL